MTKNTLAAGILMAYLISVLFYALWLLYKPAESKHKEGLIIKSNDYFKDKIIIDSIEWTSPITESI